MICQHSCRYPLQKVSAQRSAWLSCISVTALTLHDFPPIVSRQLFRFVYQQSRNVIDDGVAPASFRVHTDKRVAIVNEFSLAPWTHQDAFYFFVFECHIQITVRVVRGGHKSGQKDFCLRINNSATNAPVF